MTLSPSIPTSVNFDHWRGNTFRRQLTVLQDGVAFDFSGKTVKFEIRADPSFSVLLTLTDGNGITVAGNVLTIVVTAAQITALGSDTNFFHELRIEDGAEKTTWLEGAFRILNE